MVFVRLKESGGRIRTFCEGEIASFCLKMYIARTAKIRHDQEEWQLLFEEYMPGKTSIYILNLSRNRQLNEDPNLTSIEVSHDKIRILQISNGVDCRPRRITTSSICITLQIMLASSNNWFIYRRNKNIVLNTLSEFTMLSNSILFFFSFLSFEWTRTLRFS